MHLLGHIPEEAEVIFPRGGSFETSFRGHGSDKAIIAGLLGYRSFDPRIKNAYEYLAKEGTQVKFKVRDFPKGFHPNTIRFVLRWQDKEIDMVGASVGGGNIRVTSVLGFPIDYDGTKDVITVLAHDYPGLFVAVLRHISERGLEIYRALVEMPEKEDGTDPDMSYINIELKTRSDPDEELVEQIKQVKGVVGVRFIPKIRFAEEVVL